MELGTLSGAAEMLGYGFETRPKRTGRNEFLDTMNMIVRWAELCAR